MIRLIIVTIIILIIIGLISGIVFTQRTQQSVEMDQPDVSESPQVTGSVTPNLQAGGSSYLDSSGVFSLLYPNDWVQDTQNNGEVVRFTKIGETQRGQTEVYDGIILSIQIINLGNQTLSQWVDSQIKNATADGMSELVVPKKAITVNGYPGFSYTLRGLGAFETRAIQKNTNSSNAVAITALVADPQNKGYQKEVDDTLSTLQQLK